MLLAFATIVTAIIGFLFKDFFESLFTNLFVAGISFIATAILLLSVNLIKTNKRKSMNMLDAFLIGLMQGVSIIPAVSRSGATISTALLRGVDRELAVRFSFLLFMPAIIGATILEFKEFASAEIMLLPMIVGLITSMIVSYISIKFLIKIVKTHMFYLFGYYCLAVGIAILLYVL